MEKEVDVAILGLPPGGEPQTDDDPPSGSGIVMPGEDGVIRVGVGGVIVVGEGGVIVVGGVGGFGGLMLQCKNNTYQRFIL